MKKALLCAMLAAQLHLNPAYGQHVAPDDGYVPNAETAIAIARAVLIPIYGTDYLRVVEPLRAEEYADKWIVFGTLHCPGPGENACPGGTATIEIAKSDGRILDQYHGQ